ncbi:hypothetical protein M885DRAFT_520882 [Pelagophyceae sp. CCMP2097]|nr:hypothetical protein M885DRAFT_520882 [Pelagophyceae sp. CCMP2097]
MRLCALLGLPFAVCLLQARPRRLSVCARASSSAAAAVLDELDEIPVFVCANGEGAPLGYDREGTTVSLFYVDVAQARRDVAEAAAMYPDLGLQMLPVGLGDAYARLREGSAIIVPGADDLAAAQDPDGEPWDADTVPLFGCLEMTKVRAEDGTRFCPLFLSAADAQVALANATGSTGMSLQVVCVALPRAVELLENSTRSASGVAFELVPPAASIAFLRGDEMPEEPKLPGIVNLPGTNFGMRQGA